MQFLKGRTMGNLRWQEQPIYQITRRHIPVVAITAVRNIRAHERHNHCKNLAYLNHLVFKKIFLYYTRSNASQLKEYASLNNYCQFYVTLYT